MYYHTDQGRPILDGVAGLWCCNAGHCHPEIVGAIQRQAAQLDYATAFQMGHPLSFELTGELAKLAPASLSAMFFTNSGSEAVDTALKISLAYHQLRGQGQKQRLIGRERAYHGVSFGGISVGGIVNNRKHFGSLLPGVYHLRHTYNREQQAYSHGQPTWGAHLADDLERVCALHGASTIAAVIVEPVAGSTGVLVPPLGYLERLRSLCDRHDILLIFDEVITGFGRLGTPFAAQRFDVEPDLMIVAKGLTSGAVPMAAVLVRQDIYDTFMDTSAPAHAIELFHGYTYSGHPLACAAAMATLKVYQQENLFARAAQLEHHWQETIASLRSARHVIDIRALGLMAGIELESRVGYPGLRAFEVFLRCYEQGVLIRVTGDTIALSPALIVEQTQIEQIVEVLSSVLAEVE